MTGLHTGPAPARHAGYKFRETQMDKFEARNRIGHAMAGNLPFHSTDNVAIALATYFEEHPHKPDEEVDDELGWTPWVVEQVNFTLDAIAKALLKP